jgi:hypothetical protein
MLREVSAETGEGINEAFNEFSEFLYYYEKIKKDRIRVTLNI